MDALPFGDAKGHACGHNLIAIGKRTIEHAIHVFSNFLSFFPFLFFLSVNLTFFLFSPMGSRAGLCTGYQGRSREEQPRGTHQVVWNPSRGDYWRQDRYD